MMEGRSKRDIGLPLDLSDGERDTYTVRGRCGNCGWCGDILLPRGERAPGNVAANRVFDAPPAKCRKCGCDQVTAQ